MKKKGQGIGQEENSMKHHQGWAMPRSPAFSGAGPLSLVTDEGCVCTGDLRESADALPSALPVYLPVCASPSSHWCLLVMETGFVS